MYISLSILDNIGYALYIKCVCIVYMMLWKLCQNLKEEKLKFAAIEIKIHKNFELVNPLWKFLMENTFLTH